MKDKESLRRAQCVGKAKHLTFGAARLQLNVGKKVVKQRISKSLKLSAYKCDFCPFSHVGHQHKPKKKS